MNSLPIELVEYISQFISCDIDKLSYSHSFSKSFNSVKRILSFRDLNMDDMDKINNYKNNLFDINYTILSLKFKDSFSKSIIIPKNTVSLSINNNYNYNSDTIYFSKLENVEKIKEINLYDINGNISNIDTLEILNIQSHTSPIFLSDNYEKNTKLTVINFINCEIIDINIFPNSIQEIYLNNCIFINSYLDISKFKKLRNINIYATNRSSIPKKIHNIEYAKLYGKFYNPIIPSSYKNIKKLIIINFYILLSDTIYEKFDNIDEIFLISVNIHHKENFNKIKFENCRHIRINDFDYSINKVFDIKYCDILELSDFTEFDDSIFSGIINANTVIIKSKQTISIKNITENISYLKNVKELRLDYIDFDFKEFLSKLSSCNKISIKNFCNITPNDFLYLENNFTKHNDTFIRKNTIH